MLHIIDNEITQRLFGKSERSKQAMSNIVMSLFSRVVHIIVTLLLVPLTIDYVNPVQYGIWLTLSSIISWISFFDLGFGNGFRNKFAEARAKEDDELAKEYLSTTYFAVGSIVSFIFFLILLFHQYIDLPAILKVDQQYREELDTLFVILTFFFCTNMVLKLVNTMLVADQKVGISSLIGSLGQILSLIAIYVLSKVTEGSLLNLALYYSSIPCLMILLTTIVIYSFTKYREFVPRIKYINLSLIPDVMGLGLQLFVIYLCMLVIFQLVNIVISRELGPESVTEYNIAYRYFSVVHMTMVVVVTPFWSAFTQAYHTNSFEWMRMVVKRFEQLWMISIVILFAMLVASDHIYGLWVGESVNVSFSLSVSIACYMVINNIAVIYMYLINGIGTIRIQLIIYLSSALVSYPLMLLSCRQFGLIGIIVVPSIVMSLQAAFAKMQLKKLLNGKVDGLWKR